MNGYAWFRASINGHDTDCIIDSGSAVSVLDAAHAARIGLAPDTTASIPVKGIGGLTHSLGRTTATVTIGSIADDIELHVFPDTQLLIGTTDALAFRLQSDHETKTIYQRTARCAPTVMIIGSTKDELLASLESRSVFAESLRDVGRITVAKHTIRTKADQAPVRCAPYRYSLVKQREIDRQTTALLAHA